MRLRDKEIHFWAEVFGIEGSAVPLIVLRVLVLGSFAFLVTAIHMSETVETLHTNVGPHEIAGAALGLLLVLRTNAGYDRWWEGRRLWGGIVNQTRNLVIGSLSYGPADRAWREQMIRWTAAFPHATRLDLRDLRESTSLESLLGDEASQRLLACHHMPNAVAMHLGTLLREALDNHGMSPFAYHQAETQRAGLIDHMGACERIRSTPLPLAYRIEIRRFLVLFLTTLPFALLNDCEWFTPLAVMLVAAPVLALDKIGTELQFPFATTSLNHLPLDQLCLKIEVDLLALLDELDPLPPAASWNSSDSPNSHGASPNSSSTATKPVALSTSQPLS
ncbi:MAG: bestrophin family ion channel [Paludisphaera borealis]|uniref:bestrophin family protein n=1 Tax=Paludisphaera borealis TaxID=1387353 RepID=UPI00283D8EDA|nr:bestrophin family ion channel [Paludisphaera borealis]MDR3620006.1 bestrophin family ion channel [Paludisphaera borealis]